MKLLKKQTYNWLFDKRDPDLAELRKKYLGEDNVTVEKDKNGKTIIITNGEITGSQG